MHFGKRGIWASLRSICLNDLYCHKDLWELAVEVIFMAWFECCKWVSLGCLMGRRKRSWEKEELAFCWLCWENDTSFEKRDYTPLFLVCWDSLNTSVWVSEPTTPPWGWVTQASGLQRVSQCSRFIYYWLPWKQCKQIRDAQEHTHVVVQLG